MIRFLPWPPTLNMPMLACTSRPGMDLYTAQNLCQLPYIQGWHSASSRTCSPYRLLPQAHSILGLPFLCFCAEIVYAAKHQLHSSVCELFEIAGHAFLWLCPASYHLCTEVLWSHPVTLNEGFVWPHQWVTGWILHSAFAQTKHGYLTLLHDKIFGD